MSKPRIFISHSAKEPEAAEFLNQLYQALSQCKEEGGGRKYDVLLDKETLQVGDYWRSRINLWIGGCDAAIVILSENALSSDYVKYEASVLYYRKAVSDFRVFSVLLPPVTMEKVKETPGFREARIAEDEALKVGGNTTPAAVIKTILQKLVGLESEEAPADKYASKLARTLRKLDLEDLQEQAEFLKIDLAPWIPADNLALTLACKLIASGLAQESIRVLRALRDEFQPNPKKTLKSIIDLIAASWVDCQAATTIALLADEKEKPSLALNASRTDTAEMYVKVATLLCRGIPPNDPWRIGCALGVWDEPEHPEQAPAKLVKSVRGALQSAIGLGDTDDVEKWVRTLAANGEPVFVSLPAESGFPLSWIEDLRRKFPLVIFFLLLGNNQVKVETLDKVVLLEPQLSEGSEEIFCSNYQSTMDYLLLPYKGTSNA